MTGSNGYEELINPAMPGLASKSPGSLVHGRQ